MKVPIMNKHLKIVGLAALVLLSRGLLAQSIGPTSAQHSTQVSLQNIAQLSATASADGAQDVMVISLSTVREGPDARAVQAQLTAAVESALAQVRPRAEAGLMEVRTGGFGLYPRRGQDGKITGWQGSAELLLEGRDFSRITASAAQISGLTVSQVSFRLSPESRRLLEAQAQALAIERFKTNAAQIARAFGFSDYTLREVSIAQGEPAPVFQPRLMMAEARAGAADAALPVEAGKTSVQMTVSGSIQMK
jgi:predicted secreted protein